MQAERSAQAEFYRSIGVSQRSIERECNRRASYPVWPENDAAVRVFCALATSQWNMLAGAGGVAYIGLNYAALPCVMDLLQVPAEERFDTLWALQVIEREAIAGLNADARRAAAAHPLASPRR